MVPAPKTATLSIRFCMDAQALQLLPPRRGVPNDGYLDLDETQVQEIMNFDCVLWRIQDELWEMTQDEYEEEEDGDSLWALLKKRPQNTSSARRKMWGEDGNDARLLS